MPLTDDVLGINADGSKNEDYCMYCYKDGKFLQDCTMDLCRAGKSCLLELRHVEDDVSFFLTGNILAVEDRLLARCYQQGESDKH